MKSFYKSEVHRKQARKNLAVLAIIAILCAMIWIITMIKISGS